MKMKRPAENSATNAVRPNVSEPSIVMPITRLTVSHQTADALRERILRGVYADETPLRQDALAAEFGVSRIPVREALRQLEAEGLVVFNPHRGAVVSSLSVDEIEELFELRAQIESDLVRRAVPHTTPADLSRAKDILSAYENALRKGEVATWGELNWQLHATLYAPANRHFTMTIVQRLHRQSDRYLRMQLALTHGESRASDEHRAIFMAVRARDVKQASSLMRQHILGAGRQLLTFVRAQREADEGRQTRERGS